MRLWSIAVLVILASCASRYRLDLDVSSGEWKERVKVEGTEYVQDATLTPKQEPYIATGVGNCVVAQLSARGAQTGTDVVGVFTFDETFRARLYLQLPERITPESHRLVDSSLVQVFGRYELPPEQKLFYPKNGFFNVDSLTDGRIYLSIRGNFFNERADSLHFDGKFRVKFAH